ncbi:hypothetical protein AK812_SmicGene10479 [Symbiodinium microadriaticum]|uniref:Uncharacterized protein n=1 Tax=Symbiodinium microadriaticum TaxID=2951 RepID=A0A1Q9EFT5_SYMMI|nr:hypothetical protein AK812_SmicGene10479 [Symbiodinium microadriaticum]
MRLTRTRWPGIIELGNVNKITAKAVDQLASSVGYRLDLVLLSAGCPCASHDGAHLWVQEVVRVRNLLKQSFGVPVEMLVEAMFPLSEGNLCKFNEVLQLKPFLLDAKHLSWMHRPRLFWVTWAVTAVEGVCLVQLQALMTRQIKPRILSLGEWEKLLGFDDNYISEGLHPKYKGTDREIKGLPKEEELMFVLMLVCPFGQKLGLVVVFKVSFSSGLLFMVTRGPMKLTSTHWNFKLC